MKLTAVLNSIVLYDRLQLQLDYVEVEKSCLKIDL